MNVIINRTAAAVPNGLSVVNNITVQRPNYVGGVSMVPANQTSSNWINPLAFSLPASGTYGNLGRNAVRGPEFWQVDISLIKNFSFTERFSLDFRAEAFNVFNRAQFGNPSANFSAADFGRITTTVNGSSTVGSGTPRQFQLSLRLRF